MADPNTQQAPPVVDDPTGTNTPNTTTTTTTPVTPAVEDPATGVQKRIDVLTAEKYASQRALEEANRKARELEAQLAAFNAIEEAQRNQQTGQQNTPVAAPVQRGFSQADVQREAAVLARQQTFRNHLDMAVAQGRTAYPDFDLTLQMLTQGSGLPNSFLESLVVNDIEGVGKAQDVVYALGKNLNEAGRILALPPERQGAALAKFAASLEAKKTGNQTTANANPLTGRVSSAPDPINPQVGNSNASSSTGNVYDENLPIEEFMKLRQAASQGQNQRG